MHECPWPKKTRICELQVLKALDLPSMELMQKILEMIKVYETMMVRPGTATSKLTMTRTTSSLM